MRDASAVAKTLVRTRLRWAVLMLLGMVALSTAGYVLIEGWPVFDALYMTVITLTTVGFGETHPLSMGGRGFTLVVMVVGIGGMLYTLTALVQYVLEIEFPGLVRRRRLEERIARLRDHHIVCGVGRVGRHVAESLEREKAPFVVIDNNPEAIARCDAAGYVCVEGDATQDETLKAAGIERARGLVTALGTDEENLYVVLSARVLRPDLFVVARATSSSAETKLKLVGADRVLTPYSLAGRRMATLLLRPLVCDFVDTVSHAEDMELLLQELSVAEGSPMAGRTIHDLAVRAKTGAIILAIQRKNGAMVRAPDGSTLLQAADKLVVLGTRAQLAALEGLG